MRTLLTFITISVAIGCGQPHSSTKPDERTTVPAQLPVQGVEPKRIEGLTVEQWVNRFLTSKGTDRQVATIALLNFGPDETAAFAMEEVLKSPAAPEVRAAIDSQRGRKNLLTPFLKAKQPNLQLVIACALAPGATTPEERGPVSAILIRAIKGEDSEMRDFAAPAGMCQLPKPLSNDEVDALVGLLKRPAFNDRANAVYSLGHSKNIAVAVDALRDFQKREPKDSDLYGRCDNAIYELMNGKPRY